MLAESIDLGHNHFTGVIPSEIANLRRLEFLSINDNDFKGRVPREIGLLTNLRTLNAASNQLSGTLPNIGNMVNLKNLQLFENSFTGTIPESLLQLQSIGEFKCTLCWYLCIDNVLRLILILLAMQRFCF